MKYIHNWNCKLYAFSTTPALTGISPVLVAVVAGGSLVTVVVMMMKNNRKGEFLKLSLHSRQLTHLVSYSSGKF